MVRKADYQIEDLLRYIGYHPELNKEIEPDEFNEFILEIKRAVGNSVVDEIEFVVDNLNLSVYNKEINGHFVQVGSEITYEEILHGIVRVCFE